MDGQTGGKGRVDSVSLQAACELTAPAHRTLLPGCVSAPGVTLPAPPEGAGTPQQASRDTAELEQVTPGEVAMALHSDARRTGRDRRAPGVGCHGSWSLPPFLWRRAGLGQVCSQLTWRTRLPWPPSELAGSCKGRGANQPEGTDVLPTRDWPFPLGLCPLPSPPLFSAPLTTAGLSQVWLGAGSRVWLGTGSRCGWTQHPGHGWAGHRVLDVASASVAGS